MRLIVLLFILSFSATSVLASTVSYRFTAERGFSTSNDDIDGIVDALPISGISGTLTFDLAVLDAGSSSTLYAPPAVSVDGVDLSGVGASPLAFFFHGNWARAHQFVFTFRGTADGDRGAIRHPGNGT